MTRSVFGAGAGVRGAFGVVALLAALSWGSAVRADGPAESPCPPGNLLARAQLVRWIDTEHATALLTDGRTVPEGAPWLSQAVVFQSDAGSLTYDLGAELPLRALYVQADGAERYSLFASRDGKAWRGYPIAEVPEGGGMRSRFLQLDGATARYVRFGEPSGDGSHAVTELQLFCEAPTEGSEAPRVLARDPEPEPGMAALTASERLWMTLTGAPWLTELQAGAAKLALALAATALLLFGALVDKRADKGAEADPSTLDRVPWQRRALFPTAALMAAPVTFLALALAWPHGQGSAWSTAALGLAVAAATAVVACLRLAFTGSFYRRAGDAVTRTRLPRLRQAILAALALASFTNYYNWGSYHFPDYIHHHDLFHYFTGAKYFPELGYQNLYACASVAEAEQGFRRRVELRKIRDLSSNAIVDGATALQRAEACREAFTKERWAAFKEDVAYFREHTDSKRWQRMLRDHGYNPSPLWTLEGSTLANLRPASRGFIGHGDTMWGGALGLLDPALLLVAFAAIAWAFGGPTACVAAVFFGCNPLAMLAVASLAQGCQRFDEPIASDLVAEDRWAELTIQLDRRLTLVQGVVALLKADPGRQDDVVVRLGEARARANLRMTGEDLTDPMKVAAFVRADEALRGELARLPAPGSNGALGDLERQLADTDAAVRKAEEAYDQAARAYDGEVAGAAPGAVNKLTGKRFRPRVTLGPAGGR